MTPDDRSRDSAVGVVPRPAVPSADVRRRMRRDEDSIRELTAGVALVVLTAIGGVYFAVRPASGTVDGWFLDLVGASRSAFYLQAVSLRYPTVLVVASVILAGVCLLRDLPRAAACLIGPPLALLACELVAKPLVGRTLGGALCYPSGSTAGAAALATAAVLATPARGRVWTIMAAAVYSLWVSVSVVALRWHYPTDALAGLAFGVGVVLLVDGAAWQVARWVGQGRPRLRSAAGAGQTER